MVQRERHSEIVLFFLEKKPYSGARGTFVQNKHLICSVLFLERLYCSPLVWKSKIFDILKSYGLMRRSMSTLIAPNFTFLTHTQQTSTDLFIYQGFVAKYVRWNISFKKLYYKAHLPQTFFSLLFLVNYEYLLFHHRLHSGRHSLKWCGLKSA